MKRIIITAIATLCLISCAHTPTTGTNDALKRYFDSWVTVQKQKHPEYLWKQTELGSWILEDTPGTGELVGEFTDSLYYRVNFTQYSMDGTISGTSYAKVAQQLGTYDETYYYGPIITYGKGSYAGIEEIVKDMRDGGHRKVLIPGWLMNFNRYDTAAEYLEQSSDDFGTTTIYDVDMVEHFEYIQQWSVDSVGRYLAKTYPKQFGTSPAKAAADSAGHFGFYYIQTKAPKEDIEIGDSTIYINYTGRLLNGQVFDTTIRDTAIRYGLSRDKTYEPVSVSLSKDDWSSTTMGSSSVIAGFALTVSRMKPYEQGTGVFISNLGYKYSGSGKTIPAYAPLRFDIELVDKP